MTLDAPADLTLGFEQDLFKRALDFAAWAHGDQKVPGSGFPYVVHVTKVAMEVIAATEGAAPSERNLGIACALLHDTVEDCPAEARSNVRTRLKAEFGDAVAAGVEALTKDQGLPKVAAMADSLRRLQAQPPAVRLVKLADRITNLEPPPHDWTAEKRRAYREEARLILGGLAGSSPVLEARLRQKIEAYGRYC